MNTNATAILGSLTSDSDYANSGHLIWTILYQTPIQNCKSVKNMKLVYRKVLKKGIEALYLG